MAQFKIAHLREQGVDLIIVPVNNSFAHRPQSEQHEFIAELEDCAHSAGLAGTVVPVWRGGFIAPQSYHPFFRTFGYDRALRNINRTLTCG